MLTSDLQVWLATRVREGMAEHDIKVRDLAQAAGITPQHLSYMLTGRTMGALTAWNLLLKIVGKPLAVESPDLKLLGD